VLATFRLPIRSTQITFSGARSSKRVPASKLASRLRIIVLADPGIGNVAMNSCLSLRLQMKTLALEMVRGTNSPLGVYIENNLPVSGSRG
jgi:hypothetical protein